MIDYDKLPVATMADVQAMLAAEEESMSGQSKKRFTRETYRSMWRAVKAYVTDNGYEHTMDDLSIELTDAEWDELCRWIDVASAVLKEKPAKPLPIIKERLGYTS